MSLFSQNISVQDKRISLLLHNVKKEIVTSCGKGLLFSSHKVSVLNKRGPFFL